MEETATKRPLVKNLNFELTITHWRKRVPVRDSANLKLTARNEQTKNTINNDKQSNDTHIASKTY